MSEGKDPPPVTSEVNGVDVTEPITDENSNETEHNSVSLFAKRLLN